MQLPLACILFAAVAAALPTSSPLENDQAEEREAESQNSASTIRWLQKSVTELLHASKDLQQQNQQLRTEVAQHNVRLGLCEAATFPSGSRGPTAGGNLNTSAASNFSAGWRNLQSSGPASQGEYVRIIKRKISVDPSSAGLNGGHRRFMQAQAMQQFMVCCRPSLSVPGTLGKVFPATFDKFTLATGGLPGGCRRRGLHSGLHRGPER
jgi:TolA-binding protein